MGRALIVAGLVLVAFGLVVSFGGRFGLGHLPGDLEFRGERYAVSFPIVTCLLLSVGVSLALWIVRRFFG